MKLPKTVNLMGYATGTGAADPGCGDGPDVLRKSESLATVLNGFNDFKWQDSLYTKPGLEKFPAIADICQRLAKQTFQVIERGETFIVFGGDHSCAIGTWSGVYAAMPQQGPLGLIWIDAHLDAHTPVTTLSGNIHGMPLACLMGYGSASLTHILSPQPKLLPQHVCLIGIRSFETGEHELIQRLGVKVYYNDEVQQRGMKTVLAEALQIVKQGTAGFGISLDLDGIDPTEAPGVGTPEPNGLSAKEVCQALTGIAHDPDLLGLEIVEFNPHHDHQQLTEKLVSKIIKNFYTIGR